MWADALEARQKLPALVRRLIHATADNPKLAQFPADEGTQRRGWDGILEVERGNAWIPDGKSVWEMGADQDPERKAEADYTKRTDNAGETPPRETTFVFITPRKWEGKQKWGDAKRAENKWRDVRVWDCDDLEQWVETAPAVDAWLARLLGKLPVGVRDLASYWHSLAATSTPPLTPAIFLAGRSKTEQDLREALAGPPAEIPVSASSLSELRDFVSAVIGGGDENTENAAVAKALVVDTVDAWDHLSATKNRLLLIPGDRLALEKPMVAEAVKAGHHVLTQRHYTVARASSGVRLPRADRWEIQKALEGAGFPEQRANRLARESGGCLSVLVRLASRFEGQATPVWSTPLEAAPLLPLVLLGAWSDRDEEDRQLIERFTGEPYATTQQLVTRWLNQPDGPLRVSEGVYSFVSREESWQLLSPHFTTDLLNRFGEIANEILGEDDPRFDMPAGERYLAGIYKKLPKFSPQLREGIAETMALLGTRGDRTPQGVPEGSSWRAARLVGQLLEQASPKRWFSIAHALPLLAESAPDEFLTALEAALRQSSSVVTALFEKDADGLFASSPHTSLMWALELLAWDPTHLSRVVLTLSALIKLDTGGRIHPRPVGVLHDIFRFWYPQTAATIDERLQALDLLAKREPDVAWSLLLALIPHGHDTAMASYKPRWRDYDTSQAKEITEADMKRQAEWAAVRLVQIAEANHEKWPLLVKDLGKLPLAARRATLKWLREADMASMSADAQLETWEFVRDLVQKHRFFHDSWWVMPKSTVDELAEIERKLAPLDPIKRSKWLFGSASFDAFGTMETPHDELERLRAEAQAQAVREVFEKSGLEGVFKLGTAADFQSCITIGKCLAKLGLLPAWQTLLPEKLLSNEEHERGIALGYADGRRAVDGDPWVESLPLEEWPAEAVAEFALTLNFDRTTWQMLRRRKPDAETLYWHRVRPWAGRLPEDELEEAVRALLQNGRPMAAVDAMSTAIHGHKKPSWQTVADTVDLASSSPEGSTGGGFNTMSVWELCELMKYLQADPTADHERLVALEWRLLPLARHDHFAPTVLHAELSRNSAFFAEVLSVIYRAKDQPKDEKRDPTTQRLAEAGHDLLESWARLPGAKTDGTIDADALKNWVTEARRLCTANGKIEVCDLKIGEQLSYGPSDADGSWPCQAVRDVLELVTTDEILRGFDVGVFNQRGVTSRGLKDGGEQERELARKYRAFADKCKVACPRTALALRRIAEHYESEAKWQDERAEGRD
ncbi:MAG: alpha-crystallin domain-containing protein [Limisphaerales bacterium]